MLLQGRRLVAMQHLAPPTFFRAMGRGSCSAAMGSFLKKCSFSTLSLRDRTSRNWNVSTSLFWKNSALKRVEWNQLRLGQMECRNPLPQWNGAEWNQLRLLGRSAGTHPPSTAVRSVRCHAESKRKEEIIVRQFSEVQGHRVSMGCMHTAVAATSLLGFILRAQAGSPGALVVGQYRLPRTTPSQRGQFLP